MLYVRTYILYNILKDFRLLFSYSSVRLLLYFSWGFYISIHNAYTFIWCYVTNKWQEKHKHMKKHRKNETRKKTRKYSVYLYVWYTFNVFRLYCAYICICHMLMLILYYSETTVSLFFHRLEKEKNLLNIYIYIYIRHFVRKKYRDSVRIELSVSLCTEICTFIKTNTWQLCLHFQKFGVFSF